MAVELLREEPLAEGDGRGLVGAIHPRGAPGSFARLDDEGREAGLVLVGVYPPEPVRVLLEIERERGKGLRRAEPDELVGPDIRLGAEARAIPLAHEGVRPVRGDHEIEGAEGLGIPDLPLHADLHVERPAARCEEPEERLPGEPGERVAGRGGDVPPVMDLDRVPAMARGGHGGGGLRIRGRQRLFGGVGEDHAEAEGLVQAVPLEDLDLAARVALLQEQRGEEPGRAAADDGDPHVPEVPCRSCPAITRCWISVVPS